MPPHVLADVKSDMELARDEIFSPAVPIIRATDADDALRVADDAWFRLAGAMFTDDLDRRTRFAQ